MLSSKKLVVSGVLGALLSFPVFAAEDTPLNAADRAAIVQTLAAKINANYIDPTKAGSIGTAIIRKNSEGGYTSAVGATAFSAALKQDLREFSGDMHFGAGRYEGFNESSGPEEAPSRAVIDERRNAAARRGYEIEKIERLPGNIGYIELRRFAGVEYVGAAYAAALSLLSGTDALILDLRRNGGGDPASVAYLMSHFLPAGDLRHLNDIYDRQTDTTRQIWTVPTFAQRYEKPVYVLISARTGSAAEDCAYNFQALKRGTLVGETTLGASNPNNWFSVGHDIAVSIPTARVTNFITKTNWENVGVKPDVAVPAAQALQWAHVAILRDLVSAVKTDNERTELRRLLTMAEKGETEKPDYTRKRER
ncbi:Peptidase family S41 [Duganella sp. CF517]|uniref:S41 family peptidase n=1 Tax=Duganella sp. CF517 TaxID=1881038 RepID=UPI0008BF02FE|nr:S41 family peptidase [Duganella sp. CF517]SEN86127.1 Peptidase family S41 [Duganella sp. CF517]